MNRANNTLICTTSNLLHKPKSTPELIIKQNKNIGHIEVSWVLPNIPASVVSCYEIKFSNIIGADSIKKVDSSTQKIRIPIATNNQGSSALGHFGNGHNKGKADGCLVVSVTANFKETVVFADHDEQEENNNHCHQSLTTHKLIKTDINFPETTPEEEELLILILKRKAKFLAELEELRHELKTNAAVIEQMNLPENMLVAESNPHMNIRYGSTTEQQDYRNSIKLFNRNPEKGLKLLIEKKHIRFMGDEDSSNITTLSPSCIARFLFNGDSNEPPLLKTAIGELLGKLDSQLILIEYVKLFADHFHHQPLLQALRIYLDKFKLPGEAQQIDRIIQCFADIYVELNREYLLDKVENTNVPATPDAVYILTFSIIMLNTSLHNPNVKQAGRMSCSDFIRLNKNTNQNQPVSNNENLAINPEVQPKLCQWNSSFLEQIYFNIEKTQLKFPSQNTDAMYGTARAKVFEEPEIEGWLLIKSSDSSGLKSIVSRPKWSKKYCCLTKRMLCYVNKLEDLEPKGIITIENLKCIDLPDDNNLKNVNIFEIVPDESSGGIRRALWNNNKQNHEWNKDNESKLTNIKFSAHSPIEKARWIQAINECLGVDTLYSQIKMKRELYE